MTDIEGSLVFENSRTDVEEPIIVEDQEENNVPTSSSSSTRIVVQPADPEPVYSTPNVTEKVGASSDSDQPSCKLEDSTSVVSLIPQTPKRTSSNAPHTFLTLPNGKWNSESCTIGGIWRHRHLVGIAPGVYVTNGGIWCAAKSLGKNTKTGIKNPVDNYTVGPRLSGMLGGQRFVRDKLSCW
eukprot:sb/3471532/